MAFLRTSTGHRHSISTITGVVTEVARAETTLLKVLVRQRHLTVEETQNVLERRAARMGEAGFALSVRQLRRWLAGDIAVLDSARPANVRVVEEEFGWPIDELLAPDSRPSGTTGSAGWSTTPSSLRTADLVAWVAAHADVSFERACETVAEAAQQIARSTAHRHGLGSSRIDRARLADAVAGYYGHPDGLYVARVASSVIELSILSRPRWTLRSIALGGDAEHCRLTDWGTGPAIRLTAQQARSALDRLATAEAANTVLVDNPLYRLVALDMDGDDIRADFGCTDFATYALTSDLLEAELCRVVHDGGRDVRIASTPLRDAWLPTTEAVLSFDRRICVGGPVCLVAIADGAHYHLLVQERSGQVLNGPGTLATIPKAFHQPTVDTFGETSLSTTIERELEEELLGRSDLDQLVSEGQRRAAPLHPENASEPMRWLHHHPLAWRMECTAFGINLVTGNYEVACLVAIHDPTWWSKFGHVVEANWEALRLRRYSSVDADGLAELALDPRWSNEGLFAFIAGLRRLAEVDAERVRLPGMEPVR